MKLSVDQIRARFDQEVERFSNLQTGQTATVDAPLVLELIAQAAAATNPDARSILDIGCGAGNYTIKLLQLLPATDVTLIDLSRPMLDRASQRIGETSRAAISALQGDIRELNLPDSGFDVVVAGAILHHLRTDEEWEAVFAKLYRCVRPGGSLWISDLVEQSIPEIQALQWRRYGEYLARVDGDAYRDNVFAYIAAEDTPRPLMFQLDLLREVGFKQVDVLHKNSCFAAFGAVK